MPHSPHFDIPSHAHFVTFSCYKRRRLLSRDACKQIITDTLASQFNKGSAQCMGFVIMHDHVHAILLCPDTPSLPELMKQWKRISSYHLRRWLQSNAPDYTQPSRQRDPIWQARYYSFSLVSEEKAREKLRYIHHNPVKAGLVDRAEDWEFSSARWYVSGEDTGVPLLALGSTAGDGLRADIADKA